ncbi:membrane integrity-associated transporter subunit PqiC [Bordetella genomosp. 13]|uniref:PqiC family protein n=1 Tax=Bordetella genomosp. 13 TaxID=463040 RepID=UPI0011A9E7FD|nr:PqiC family protein [Bordetella genomosp. 13]
MTQRLFALPSAARSNGRARTARASLFRLAGAAALAAATLAGCAGSPPVRYHTLVAPPSAAGVADAPAQTAAVPAGYMIEVLPVSVPPQVDQPQLMLRSGTGQLTAQYSDRWSSPLSDEFRDALSAALTQRLGVPDVRVVKPLGDTPVWRVLVDVQRFESTPGAASVIEATWRVRRDALDRTAGLLCRSRVDVPVPNGTAAADAGSQTEASLVQAHQQAVVLLGDTIASAIRSQGKSATPASARVRVLGCVSA